MLELQIAVNFFTHLEKNYGPFQVQYTLSTLSPFSILKSEDARAMEYIAGGNYSTGNPPDK